MRRWILEPVDGTDPFLAGQRDWGTHVALEVDGELQVVVLTRPTKRRRWWAVRDPGAFVDARSVLADTVRQHAHWVEDPLGPVVGLLEGRVDAVLGPGGAIWDHAPQVLLTIEAGGRYTDRIGGHQLDAGGGLYTNGRLDELIHATRGLRQPDWPT